jgi:small-conductance mechanosensitive channel
MVTKAYAFGDRIENAGIRGNAVDHNALTTTILEIGPGQTSHQYTGRTMVIPNSFFLIIPLKKFLAEFHFAPRFALPGLTHVPETSISS